VSDLLVAGAGMAGLAAAATAHCEVWEKGDRLGGSLALSSGVVWRYRDFETFRAQCPSGNPSIQRLIHEGFDEALGWLESLGAPVLEHSTGNPLTVGKRFDTAGLISVLAAHIPRIELGRAVTEHSRPLILATGGFQADRELVAEHITAQPLKLRSNPWSAGDGLRIGLAAGGSLSVGMEQFYGRALPPDAGQNDWIAAAQLYARHGMVVNDHGERYAGPVGWAEVEPVQWLARQDGARGWIVVASSSLDAETRYGSVRALIDRAAALGSRVEQRGEGVAVEVVAAITQTLGGLAVDTRGRVADGLWAAGGDVGGVATGGYMSNLAAALVMGRVVALDALS
jgi:succinate dehydrogenase/fumarate reductase flavoprotein subunit